MLLTTTSETGLQSFTSLLAISDTTDPKVALIFNFNLSWPVNSLQVHS